MFDVCVGCRVLLCRNKHMHVLSESHRDPLLMHSSVISNTSYTFIVHLWMSNISRPVGMTTSLQQCTPGWAALWALMCTNTSSQWFLLNFLDNVRLHYNLVICFSHFSGFIRNPHCLLISFSNFSFVIITVMGLLCWVASGNLWLGFNWIRLFRQVICCGVTTLFTSCSDRQDLCPLLIQEAEQFNQLLLKETKTNRQTERVHSSESELQ